MIDPIPQTKPVPMTRAQRATLERKFEQGQYERLTWQEFLESAESTFGCDGAIAVPWCGMWLCIETDGYCHT